MYTAATRQDGLWLSCQNWDSQAVSPEDIRGIAILLACDAVATLFFVLSFGDRRIYFNLFSECFQRVSSYVAEQPRTLQTTGTQTTGREGSAGTRIHSPADSPVNFRPTACDTRPAGVCGLECWSRAAHPHAYHMCLQSKQFARACDGEL